MINKIITHPIIVIIKFYQFFISPMLGQNCRYLPTCSEYTVGCLKNFGLIKGIFLAINFSNKDLTSPLFIIGFLSSFTTFSAFTKEVLLFSNTNGLLIAYLTALIITSICLLSTFVGYKIFS